MSLHLVSASAGTGKTEKLSQVVADAIGARDGSRIEVEGLVAVTYTRKAEAELRARIRQTLIKASAYDEAQQLPLAYVGTVHAICKRLLTEFALSAGLSPQVDVLPESVSERAVTEAIEAAISVDHRDRLEDVCRRLRPNWDATKRRYRWIPDAEDLIELARSNRIEATSLGEMAKRSLAGLLPLLGKVAPDGAAIEAGLRSQIDRTLRHLGDGDETQVTDKAIATLKDIRRAFTLSDPVPWTVWAQLSALEAAAAHRDVMAELNGAAALHTRHPRFQGDVAEYLTLLYGAVAMGLSGYSAWKEERRYIDYVDMEERALDLLARPEIAGELEQRLQLLVVDEFQDTSPIQLALFLRLEELCRRSVWVGDRKQSIFAFRGADPALMDAVIEEAAGRGDETEVLGVNWRSRESLVDFCSDLFALAFAPHGHKPEQVRVAAKRTTEDPRLATLPPLGVWLLETRKVEQDAEAIAEGVRGLLENPAATPVVDRATGAVRDLRASDVALLTATNDEAHRLAQALGARGIPAAVPRKRLLDTPEGTLLHAALRVIADERDSAAAAHLDALSGFEGEDPDRWLERLLDAHAAEAAFPLGGLARTLHDDRTALIQLSPTEAVDHVIGLFDLCARCASWPHPDVRIANLEAFRGLAAEYENDVAAAREAGTIVGFLHFLVEAGTSQRINSDAGRSDDQHAGGGDSVQICTYHRAKGLEWPVVILTSLHSKTRAFGIPPDASAMRLERGGRSQLFSSAPETDAEQFDPKTPLAGRWLRFWPWPYGGLKNAELANVVAGTPESRRLVDAAARESLRLLYVGFTRARDHLILAARAKRKEVAVKRPKGGKKEPAPPILEVTIAVDWLDTINDGTAALLELPIAEGEAQSVAIRASGGSKRTETPARARWLDTGTEPPARLPRPEERIWYSRGPQVVRDRTGSRLRAQQPSGRTSRFRPRRPSRSIRSARA